MFVKLKEGRTLFDPRTRERVPDQGLEVPDHDPFWIKRLDEGDVERIAAPHDIDIEHEDNAA